MIEKDGDHQVEIAGKRGKNKPVTPAVDPPDGGWGWFVVFGVFISTALAQGAVATYPIFYLPLMQEFGIGLGEVTWLTGCYEFGRAFGYLFAPILVDKLGYRETGVLVSIASSIGICLAAFSPTPIMAYILAGVIPGCSYGIVSTVHYVVIVKYFYKRQMLALGLSHTGAAFGTLSLAPLLQYLIDYQLVFVEEKILASRCNHVCGVQWVASLPHISNTVRQGRPCSPSTAYLICPRGSVPGPWET